MHKSYYTLNPCQSRYLQKQIDEAAFERHRKELQSVKPLVDTSPPKTYMHLHLKPKKLQMEAEKQASIDHENRLLLAKMSHIVKTGGSIDNSNNYTPKSLNSKRRQGESMAVVRENKAILQRMLDSSRESKLANWQGDWQRNVDHIDRLSRFPNNWWERSPGGQSYRSPRKSEGKQAETGRSDSSEQPQQEERKDP